MEKCDKIEIMPSDYSDERVAVNSLPAREKRTQTITEEYDTKYDADFVSQNIKLPEDPANIPQIIGWSGPARSGTTALLYLLAGYSQVDRIYFQPQTTLLRFGYPRLDLRETDELICMKEVFFSSGKAEPLDPIDTLLKAGVPPEKITWIAMLRDPLQTFGSCEKYGDTILKQDPDVFALWQSHTIALWHKYKDSDVTIIPFVYELLKGQEKRVLRQLFNHLGIAADVSSLSLAFNPMAIKEKLVPGQAADREYFEVNLYDTLKKGEYRYTANNYTVDMVDAQRLKALCQKEYEAFLELAERELKL